MNKHTPGPWTTNRNEHDAPYQDIKINGKHHHIALIWMDDAPVTDYNREQEANARLIVAAPDLLAACEAGLQLINVEDLAADEVMEQMRAAIEKAKGGQGE